MDGPCHRLFVEGLDQFVNRRGKIDTVSGFLLVKSDCFFFKLFAERLRFRKIQGGVGGVDSTDVFLRVRAEMGQGRR